MSYSLEQLNPISILSDLGKKHEDNVINQTNQTVSELAKQKALSKSKLKNNASINGTGGTLSDQVDNLDNMYNDQISLIKNKTDENILRNRISLAKAVSAEYLNPMDSIANFLVKATLLWGKNGK